MHLRTHVANLRQAESDQRAAHLAEQLRLRTAERDTALVERNAAFQAIRDLRQIVAEKQGSVIDMAQPVPAVHIASATITVYVTIGADAARVTALEETIMTIEESVDGVRAEFDSFKSDVTAKLEQLQAAVDANDPAAVQAKLDELLADVQGAHAAVGDADGDGVPAASVVAEAPPAA